MEQLQTGTGFTSFKSGLPNAFLCGFLTKMRRAILLAHSGTAFG
jgi:hypothetical protein